MTPPRWSERLLRTLLLDRDRETISGDLLEEYRQGAVPTLGVTGARWWYRRQVAGFLWQSVQRPLLIGLAFGTILGVMTLVDTARQPLADDDAGTMLAWIGAVLAIWSAAAVAVTWRTRRIGDAIKVGTIVGVATIVMIDVAAFVRINLFLEAIRHRDDWHNLVARYNQSGFHSLRAYANYEYATLTPTLIALGAVAGSLSGALGGLVNAVRRARRAG